MVLWVLDKTLGTVAFLLSGQSHDHVIESIISESATNIVYRNGSFRGGAVKWWWKVGPAGLTCADHGCCAISVQSRTLFNQGHFPSVVAYVPSGGSEHIFWDLGILYDRLKDITTSESASNLLRNFNQIAIKFGIKEQLHLRGSVSRCGVGSESWVIFSFLSYETNTIWLFQCWKCADSTFAEFEGVVLWTSIALQHFLWHSSWLMFLKMLDMKKKLPLLYSVLTTCCSWWLLLHIAKGSWTLTWEHWALSQSIQLVILDCKCIMW